MSDEEVRPTWDEILADMEGFYDNPSTENYVAMRRRYPAEHEIFEFAKLGLSGLDELLENAGLEKSVVRSALGGDYRDIDELCLQVLERLIERRRLEANGETHLQSRGKAISDALINHLIVGILEVLHQDGAEPRSSFVMLVREQLGGQSSGIMKSAAKEFGRERALWLAFQMRRGGEQPTIRKIAEKMNVEASTVSRWFPDDTFREQVERFSSQFVRFPPRPIDP